MLRSLHKLTHLILLIANALIIGMMLLTGYAGYISPTAHPQLSCIGLLFPLFLLANLGCLVLWACIRLRYTLLPMVGFLLCFSPLRHYFPINIHRSTSETTYKVLSYNTWGFGTAPAYTDNPIMQYIHRQDADIVCLQESSNSGKQASFDSLFAKQYPYIAHAQHKPTSGSLMLLSKYPIIKSIPIPFTSPTGNLAHAWLLRTGADSLLVVNCHLQSIGLTEVEKAGFQHIIEGDLSADESKSEALRIIRRLGHSNIIRTEQVYHIALLLRQYADTKTILCGDFNASPQSWAHRVIGKHLTDTHTAAGNGPGISYHHNNFYVRIDNIFCSSHFVPLKCIVDNSITQSDHYPIISWLKLKG